MPCLPISHVFHLSTTCLSGVVLLAGVYILEKLPPGGGISVDGIWGKKYEKVKRKRGKM
jgi:hypothetical protein